MMDQGRNKTLVTEGQGVTWKLDEVQDGAAIIESLGQRHQYIQTTLDMEVDKHEYTQQLEAKVKHMEDELHMMRQDLDLLSTSWATCATRSISSLVLSIVLYA